jgi:mannosylglucosylglycerate synthase
VLVVENALTIPMHLPLGLALTEFIAETAIPTIAHHHDFYWERQRFLQNCVDDYLAMSFPPRLPAIRHVVINSTNRVTMTY